MLLLRLSEVRVEFNMSTSDNLIAPSLLILLPVLSENHMKSQVLPLRLRKARDEFNASAPGNLIVPSSPILLSELSEYEMKHKQICFIPRN
jgi:hypothetical protein